MRRQQKSANVQEKLEPEVWSSPTMYSQPLAETIRADAPPIVFAGFVGGKGSRTIGFILRKLGRKAGKPKQVEATRETIANEQPRGFFSSLARLYMGGPH
jgi:hypothetical protein